jgi:hypothetical protein
MSTKGFLYIFFSLFINCYCLAQKAQLEVIEKPDVSRYKTLTVALETKKKYSTPSHFKYIRIVDRRADKSKLGVAKAGEQPEDRRFVLPDDFTFYLQEKLNKICDRSSEAMDTAVFIINNAWLYQTVSPAGFLKQQALGAGTNWMSNCFLNLDCYIVKNNSYSWLCAIDTVITSRGWLPGECNHVLSSAFSAAVAGCDSIFISKLKLDSQLTKEKFQALVLSGYEYPILTVQKFSKGIFNTYKDFLENNVYPLEMDVYYQKNKRFIKSKTLPDSVVNKGWGFSDGKDLFININGSFYKLIRSENTFDLIGPRIIEYKTSTFNKAITTALTYFFISGPFIDPSDFMEPSHQTLQGFKLYQLNITDGIFR